MCHPEMLVFVEETGSDRRTCLRRYGYALKSRRAMSRKLLLIIGAMCMNGMLDVYITDTSVNSLHAGGHVCGPCACIQDLPVTREATYVALAIAGQSLLALFSVS